MSGWVMIVIMFLIVEGAVRIVRIVMGRSENPAVPEQNPMTEEQFKRIEQRIANLESILLDREKKNEFDQALK